ncbi:hypothetical protein GCM10009639_45250 [Kitasatospora putterlickiae]|uniref:Integral membrane protein n=1 Tax=Kitasatospora putterlickiae TaxID=221725 RepID=A0ABN1YA59_9ACTN
MNAPAKDAKAPVWIRVAGALAAGLFLLAGLATAVLGFRWFVEARDATLAHRSAPVCGTASHRPGTDCVLHETGKVTDRYTVSGDGTTYYVKVARETVPTHRYDVTASFYGATKVGADVDLTIYRGRVAELSYQGHRTANVGTPWVSSLQVSLTVGLGAALTVLGLALSRVGARVGSFAAAVGGFTAVTAMLGCLTLIAKEWPVAALLAVPVLGWLFTTAAATVVVWDETSPRRVRR